VVDAHAAQELVEVDVLGIYLEPQLGHDHLQLVFKLLILKGVLLEVPLEYWMQEHLIPVQPLLLIDSQAVRQKIASLGSEPFVYL